MIEVTLTPEQIESSTSLFLFKIDNDTDEAVEVTIGEEVPDDQECFYYQTKRMATYGALALRGCFRNGRRPITVSIDPYTLRIRDWH